jgi:hypothetical protein
VGKLRNLSRWFFEHPLVFLFLFVALYGLRPINVSDFELLSSAPLALLQPSDQQPLHSSPFTFFVGYPFTHYLGWKASYLLVNGFGIVFFTFAFFRFLNLRFGESKNLSFYLFAATPLFLIVVSWFGKSDPYLVGFFFLFITVESYWAAVISGIAMVLCHRDMATLMLLFYLLLFQRRWFATVSALLLGHAAVLAYQYGLLPSPPESRQIRALELLPGLFRSFMHAPIAHLLFTFGPFWIVAAILAVRNKVAWNQWLVLALCFGAALWTEDYTRVFTILSVPLVAHFLIQAKMRNPLDLEFAGCKEWLPVVGLFQCQLFADKISDSNLYIWINYIFLKFQAAHGFLSL